MVNPWILASPASRGIGFHFARQLLATTSLPVIATARTDLEGTRARILEGLEGGDKGQGKGGDGADVAKRLEVLRVDVMDESTIAAAAAHCAAKFPPSQDSYLHLALCIPGILHPEKSPAQISHAHALRTFQTNTLGPLLLLKHFSPFLPRKATTTLFSSPSSSSTPHPTTNTTLPRTPTFALMSARVGSISDNTLGGWYSYRASKAAVNQLAKTLDLHLRHSAGDRAMAVALHPGTVRTGLSEGFWDSTSREKLFEPGEAAAKLLAVLKGLRVEEARGRCWDWKGEEVPP